MEHFLEHFPPQKDGLTDEEKVKELRNLKDEILTTLNSFSRFDLIFLLFSTMNQ